MRDKKKDYITVIILQSLQRACVLYCTKERSNENAYQMRNSFFRGKGVRPCGALGNPPLLVYMTHWVSLRL